MVINKTEAQKNSTLDCLTIVAVALLAYSLTVFLHEGTHALTCLSIGGSLKEFSALYIDCQSVSAVRDKIVAGSAPLFNLIFGFGLLLYRRRKPNFPDTWQWFTWLFMLMNLLTGAGYLMFSGTADIGDLATVIAGWQPSWLWHVGMALVGSVGFMGFVWLALKELGQIIGGTEPELYKRAVKLGVISYLTAIVLVVITGLSNPHGFLSLPVTAGLGAAFGAMSPLLWMMFWFRAKMFTKKPSPALEISRQWGVIGSGLVIGLIFAVVLGNTINF